MTTAIRTRVRLRATEAVLIVLAVLFVLPFVVLVNVALKRPADVNTDALSLTRPSLGNFSTAWRTAGLGQALTSSVVVAVISVVLLVVLGSSAAYVFARRTTRLSRGLYLLVLVGLMVPLQLAMVPLYQLMKDLGLLQTFTSLILFNTGTQLPFTVFLFAAFIRALPRDYEEAAALDGASPRRVFARIVFPLLRPVTATVVILDGIDVWKDFLTPLLYVGGSPQQTLPVAVFTFRGEYATQWGVLFSGIIVSIAPVLVLFLLLQRYIINGFAGGLKG